MGGSLPYFRLRLIVEAFAFLLGVVIFFGAVFFWQSAQASVKVYSTFSFVALSVGAALVLFGKQTLLVLIMRSGLVLITAASILGSKTFNLWAVGLLVFLLILVVSSAFVWKGAAAASGIKRD